MQTTASTAAPTHTLQGRYLGPYNFPSPATQIKTFASKSICLVDLGGSLLVLTHGNLNKHENGLYRLNITDRADVAFDDDHDTQLTKDQCKDLLDDTLALYPHCEVLGVNFPFFEQENLKKFKGRLALCLYGEDARAIYLATYMGPRPTHQPEIDWELQISGKDHLLPPEAAQHIVDVSKVCTLPPKFDNPGNFWHRKETYWRFETDGGTEMVPKLLSAKNGAELRRQAVLRLQQILISNPYPGYVDSTRDFDVGTDVYEWQVLGEEEVLAQVVYK